MTFVWNPFRTRTRLATLLPAAIAAAVITGVARAQSTDAGAVTGRVYCADTQKPARFAMVRLQTIDVSGRSSGGRGGFATTGPDGSFSMSDVSAGDYYADVTMPGYVQPLRGHYGDLQQMSTADRDRINAQLTRVSVQANQSVAVQVTIYRGATVSGAVSYDDGAPAPGIAVQAFTAPPDATTGSLAASADAGGQTRQFAASAYSDDRGQFRLTGLSAGIYTVQATPRSVFPVFYGNTIEVGNAKKLDLHTADEATGIDIQIPAAGMHRVSGVVVSQGNGHGLAHASVQLTLASGNGNPIGAVSGTDGSFTFAAVPDGKFLAQATGAYDSATHTSYSGQSLAVEVNGTDIPDLVLNVTPHN